MSLYEELKRRQVFRVALAYLAASWLLIQVLETLFPIFGLAETSIRVVVILLATGFIPAVVLAWVFEWTSSGIQRDADVERSQPSGPRSRNFDRAIIAVLTVAVVYFTADRFVIRSSDNSGQLDQVELIARDYARTHPLDDASVAVLPFTASSDDERQVHFAYGLSDAIRVMLASVEQLRVVAKSSVERYAESSKSARQIGETLNVDRILSGTVRRSAETMRITAELIDVNTESVLWADRFDANMNLENVFDIQDRVAAAVVEQLGVDARAAARKASDERPQSIDAMDAYHDGLFAFNQLMQDQELAEDEEAALVQGAIEHFNRAINADPGWSPPRAMLGRLYHFRFNAGDDPSLLALSRRHIFDALLIDDQLATARNSNAYLMTIDRQFSAALEEYRQGKALGSADAAWGLGILYRYLGMHREAIKALQEAVSLNPLVLPIRWQLAQSYYCAGEYRAAIDDFETYFSPQEDDIASRILLANAYARAGEIPRAMAMANGIVELTGDESLIATVFIHAGDTERASAAIGALSETPPPFVTLDVVPAAILLGETEIALAMLEDAAAAVSAEIPPRGQLDWIWKLRCLPEIQGLDGHPRYNAILESFDLAN